jgi:hypothetical protein
VIIFVTLSSIYCSNEADPISPIKFTADFFIDFLNELSCDNAISERYNLTLNRYEDNSNSE